PHGIVTDGKGGIATLKLTDSLMLARYLRIRMTGSSNTASTHDAKDPRSSVGYAIHEIYVGTFSNTGDFIDLVKHTADGGQNDVRVSSVDPWHSATDIDMPAGDQTGMDLFYTSGITNKLPAMIPIAMLYSSPEDAAAQIAYVKKRGY